jgi:putative copper export protein
MVDVLSVLLRAGSFVGLFQAAGTALFAILHASELAGLLPRLRRLSRAAALAGIVASAGHCLLEPARMAGELGGVLDASLERLFWSSPAGAACAVRIVGLTLIAATAARPALLARLVAASGIGLAVLSFLLTGHTATSAHRWALAPLLGFHLLVVAFWFGALAPLYLVTRSEPPRLAGQVVAAFSGAAAWLVAAMFLAALGLAVGLIPGLAVLGQPYGELLLTKIGLFTALLALAALNKWRFGPAVAHGDARATAALQRSIIAEHVLICCVLAVTAVMTSWFSPETAAGP